MKLNGITIFIIALALAGAGYYIYLQKNKDEKPFWQKAHEAVKKGKTPPPPPSATKQTNDAANSGAKTKPITKKQKTGNFLQQNSSEIGQIASDAGNLIGTLLNKDTQTV